MADLPAMAPPAGVVPDFDHPHNQNALTYGVLGSALGISTIALALRIYSRWFVVRQPFIGDYTLIAAYGFFGADIALVFNMAHSPGLFVHQYELYLKSVIPFLHDTFNASNVFSVFVALVKTSILLEWLRIFVPPGTRNFVYWACHTLMWANIIYYILMVILVCVSCSPFEYHWNKLIHGTCRIDTGWTDTGAAGINVATDICILLLPQRVIWKLQMNTQRKIGVAAIFSIGLLGVVAACFRVGVTVVRATSDDFTFTFSSVVLCALAEGTCAILVVCGPTMPKAFSGINMSKLKSSLRSWIGSSAERLRRSGKAGDGGSEGDGDGDILGKSSISEPYPRFLFGQKSSNRVNDKTYENIDEYSLVPIPLPASQLRPVASDSNVGNQYDRFDKAGQTEMGPGGIVRSTHFEAVEQFGMEVGAEDYECQHERQHPWKKSARFPSGVLHPPDLG